MKLQFLGVGGAFALEKNLYQSNMIITTKNGKTLLIDPGMTSPLSLMELGYTKQDMTKIDAFYVSHLHSDHIGAMEFFGLLSFFTPPMFTPKIELYGVSGVLRDLWNKSLRGGMETLQGRENNLGTYFKVKHIKLNDAFHFDNLKLQPVQTIHIMAEMSIVPSFGLLISALDDEFAEKIFITTDTQFAPHQIKTFYDMSDIIFHDCETLAFPDKDGKLVSLKSGVHAHIEDLHTLNNDTKSKMWLYHYQQENPPYNAEQLGFRGFVKKHQIFTFGK